MSRQHAGKLTDHKAIIFDVYGTLVDWETGIYNGLLPILPTHWSRADALKAFGSVESDLQARFPTMLYRDILAEAHKALAERWGCPGGSGRIRSIWVRCGLRYRKTRVDYGVVT
ncbi:hypothetical protein PLICRDRAFT_172737 [Plicaturopsis crispa FD-325 SS-3]|nr:hypothetical protein PLICRDRAFT_172737 [Plicaturopsis crispa FD-325 SS-3]